MYAPRSIVRPVTVRKYSVPALSRVDLMAHAECVRKEADKEMAAWKDIIGK